MASLRPELRKPRRNSKVYNSVHGGDREVLPTSIEANLEASVYGSAALVGSVVKGASVDVLLVVGLNRSSV